MESFWTVLSDLTFLANTLSPQAAWNVAVFDFPITWLKSAGK